MERIARSEVVIPSTNRLNHYGTLPMSAVPLSTSAYEATESDHLLHQPTNSETCNIDNKEVTRENAGQFEDKMRKKLKYLIRFIVILEIFILMIWNFKVLFYESY